MGRSLALALCVSLIALLAGTWIAWVECRTHFAGRRVAAMLAILPLATPSYLIATIVREEMAPAGQLGAWLGRSGSFTLNVRVARDSVIWMSISPALGVEAARILLEAMP